MDGKPLQVTVTLVTEEVELQVGALHREKIAFYVLPKLSHAILLGLPWLRTHQPVLEWSSGEILRWGHPCQARCLTPVRLAAAPRSPPDLPGLPPGYSSYADVFDKKEAEVLPPHRPFDCPIELVPGSTPPRGRIYPLSPAETTAMSEYVQENLAKGFIRKSSLPAGAGFFFVKKKDGTLRPCIDTRCLNEITIKNRYPLPLIPELFDHLRGARVFSKLDLRGAYNLVRIRAGDEWKTAFNTRDGHYEYLVMPFGLCNAPAVFQEFVNEIFRDLLYSCVVVYLDDILVFSPDLSSHRKSVRLVLQRLWENRLYAKIEKCLFEQTSLLFLGFIISDAGLRMDPEKLSAILKWPCTIGLKAIQRFLGFANYYRQFVSHFSAITRPISALTRKGPTSKDWSPEAEEAFLILKRAFSTASVLHCPESDRPFVLEVDASSTGAGAVLSQRTASGRLQLCGFFSKAFSPSECNYSIGDRELLAIKLALEEWRHLLEGAVHPFVIFSDHKNLTYLQSAQGLNPRQARWSLFFARFDFELRFRPGNKNSKADALSRVFQPHESTEEPSHIIDPTRIITVATVNWLTPPPGQTLVPENQKQKVLL
ncbi:coiled-coil domain-containing protein 24 isoform X1 [Dendrobates tinctorius]|uniref:coiled-coil domain-containing protein 24 isoform X1 n=1 Tax=Dendrobates tinctorius TaxID=92724 RepID=UPI003CC95B0E